MQNDKYLTEEFEKDIWLYLDNELSEERMVFWEKQIKENEAFGHKLQDTSEFLSNYKNFESDNISQYKFEEIIAKAIKHERLFSRIISFFKSKDDSEFLISKIAFVSSLSIAALIVLILSQKPNPINRISNEIISWEDETTETEIRDISNSISLIENDNMKNYLMYKTLSNEWSHDVYRIENQIKNLDNELNKNSFVTISGDSK